MEEELEKLIDTGFKRPENWFTNVGEHEVERNLLEYAEQQPEYNFWSGEPAATEKHDVKQMREWGMVGLYRSKRDNTDDGVTICVIE